MIKKIHQLSNLKEFDLESQKKLRELNPKYEYKLWEDDDLKSLFENNYPECFELWDKMREGQRADLGRYLILYLEGGFYCDTNFYTNKSLDSLGELIDTYFAPSTPDFLFMESGFSNYFIYSPSGDKFFIKAIEESLNRIRETTDYNQPSYISYTTGKNLLTKLAKELDYKVNIFSEKKIINKYCDFTDTGDSFAYHDGGTSRTDKNGTWLNSYVTNIMREECNLRKNLRVRGNLCQIPIIFILAIFLGSILGFISFRKYKRITLANNTLKF